MLPSPETALNFFNKTYCSPINRRSAGSLLTIKYDDVPRPPHRAKQPQVNDKIQRDRATVREKCDATIVDFSTRQWPETHSANCKNFSPKKNIDVAYWPAQSPHLNPIETFSGRLRSEFNARTARIRTISGNKSRIGNVQWNSGIGMWKGCEFYAATVCFRIEKQGFSNQI